MHKNLIIHSNNIPHLNDFKNTIKFTLSSSSIDEYISDDIISQIKNKEFDTIYIKDSLSANYLEFYGLLLSYHIRLSSELRLKRFVPIVILSDLDGYMLNKITPIANILFTKNIFIGKNNKKTIEYYNSLSLSSMTEEEYRENFLNLIDIEPPRDYLSRHSITNEWSIYRWSKFLNIKDSQTIEENKNKISSMLYFKYLIEKYPIQEKKGITFVPKPPKSEGNILYIDDQWKSGWQDIFNYYFEKIKNINFTTVEELYKDKTQNQLLESIGSSIKDIYPDLILLDLRLHEDDHKCDVKEEDFSGIKLLKYIKEEVNPGIQVIILTASGNSLIIKEAYKYNIVGYVKKEHPGDLTVNAKDNFNHLREFIDLGLDKKYLKQIWILQNNILGLSIFNDGRYNQIKIEIESIFEILDSNMEKKFVYTMFSIFKVFENIIDLYIEEKRYNKRRYAYWLNSEQKIKHIDKNTNYPKTTTSYDKNDSTENKIRIVLYEKLILTGKTLHDKIHNIVQIRNNIIHPSKHLKNFTVDENNILEWFEILFTILDSIDTKKI